MITSLLFVAALGAAQPLPELTLPAHDHLALLRADEVRRERGEPIHYAVPETVADLWVQGLDTAGGRWRAGAGDTLVWEARIVAKGASSIDLGLTDYWLPQGASLSLSDGTGSVTQGPWTDAENRDHGELWTPVVPGQEALLTLTVPLALAPHVRFRVQRVNSGYRFFNEETIAKALECNVDVACPAGDPYRDIRRSAAMYTNGSGAGICSGAMINSAGEQRPYFLTARHCGVSAAAARSLVFYFNYESNECRTGVASGITLPRSIADTVSGATLIAQNGESDFLLLALDEEPPADFRIYYAGWDRSGTAPAMGVSIHHPRTDEKRLAIENDPLVTGQEVLPFFDPPLAPGSYWEVLQWDVGITEGGSSGSPLFDGNQRIVGQLAGGATFRCPGAEEGSDWYGKLSLSWEAGSTPGSRLRDWLDPGNSGAETLDGEDSCEAPEVDARVSTVLAGVGERVTFSATVSGGSAPYRFEWDLDGDGVVDSRLATPEASFPALPAADGRVTAGLSVIDATGCPARAQVGLVIEGPELVLESAPIEEQCGDGDDRIERGEVWRFPITVTNSGERPALGTVVAFDRAGDVTGTGPDDFGYTAFDSDSEFCSYSEVDLADALDVTPNATDDGGTLIDLGTDGFTLYGQPLTALLFSTNGYLSTDAAELGDDFSNDCPLPANPDRGGGARIMPLHDDLVVQGALRHRFYERCPRPADIGAPDQACEAFAWEGMEYFRSAADFDVQAFLYPETEAIAFQYRGEDPLAGSGATIGLQNAPGTDALSYACNEGAAVEPGLAVCVFSPAAQPPTSAASVGLLSPVIQLGDLSPGASVERAVSVRIEADADCGAAIRVRYLGAAHEAGFVAPGEDDLLTAQVRAGARCESASTGACPLPTPPDFQPKDGFWLSPERPGNGLDLHFQSAGGLYGAWYTASRERRLQPTWYYLQSLSGQNLVEDQLAAEILAFSGPLEGPPSFRTAGTAVLNFIDADRAFLAWELDGERGGELLEFFDLGAGGPVVAAATDQFFSPAEAGWGVALQQQDGQAFAVIYLYDEEDQPSWLAATGDAAKLLDNGSAPLGVVATHCPGCLWTTPETLNVGDLSLRLDSELTTGSLSIDALLEEPFALSWERRNLEIQSIRFVPPQGRP